jgi:hypothetical protein
MGNARINATDIQRGESMSELKRDYWSETLTCVTGKVKIDRREIVAIVTPLNTATLEIHLKSGTIFTITNWDVNTIANLYLTQSPHEEVKVVPNTFTIREGKAPFLFTGESEE